MLELNFTPFPILTTERLVLRQLVDNDVNEVFFLRSDEGVLKYINKEPARSTEDALVWMQLVDANQVNGDSINWAITLKNEPTLIGNVCLWRIQKDHYRAELGYTLHPSLHRKGIMPEAIKAVLDYGFTTMGLHSVEAHINPENMASAKVLEKTGFVREAYFKENYYYGGKFLDSAVYSLITPLK